MFKQITKELKNHAPFTFFGALTGIVIIAFFQKLPSDVSYNIFYILHPIHVVLSALVTASMYELHKCEHISGKCLRACVKRSSSWFKSMQHKINHSHIDHCLTAIGQCFIVFTEPTVFGEPTKCSLHNPAFRENLKNMNLAAFNNLNDPIELLLCPFHKKTTITTICPD